MPPSFVRFAAPNVGVPDTFPLSNANNTTSSAAALATVIDFEIDADAPATAGTI
jgi:hypothetical protein